MRLGAVGIPEYVTWYPDGADALVAIDLSIPRRYSLTGRSADLLLAAATGLPIFDLPALRGMEPEEISRLVASLEEKDLVYVRAP